MTLNDKGHRCPKENRMVELNIWKCCQQLVPSPPSSPSPIQPVPDNMVCLWCGEFQRRRVEPNAGKYTCDACGAEEAYGLDEALRRFRMTLAT